MCGLAINMATFANLLKRMDFDAVVAHLAIMHIMKSKAEPASNRIKRLLEILSAYSFNLYYIKGKDMVLSDFLSRQHGDNSNPHELIPISFNMGKVLQQNYQNYAKTYLVQTRSQNKASNARSSNTHTPLCAKAAGKLRKEIKPISINDEDDEPIIIDSDTKRRIEAQIRDTTVTKGSDSSAQQDSKDIMYPKPIVRPLPKPPELIDKTQSKQNTKLDPKVHFEENSHHREGIILETYINPDQTYNERPQELTDVVNTTKLVQKYLPRQVDIDKILDVIKRKVFERHTFALTIKEMQAGYLTSLHFKDIYRYLAQNNLPRKRRARQKVENLSDRYVLLDSLLFKINPTPGKEKALLAIPEVCADKIIMLYHASLFAGHQGMVNTYLIISDKFFVPNLMHYLRSYLKACHIC